MSAENALENYIRLPAGDKVSDVVEKYGLTSVRISGTEYFFAPPRDAIFPEDYTLNGNTVADNLTSSANVMYGYSAYNVYIFAFLDNIIQNNYIETTTNRFNLISNTLQNGELYINGIRTTYQEIVFNVPFNTIDPLAVVVFLPKPINTVKFNGVEFTIKVIPDGTTIVTPKTYYHEVNPGVYATEVAITEEEYPFKSWRNDNASTDYIDAYGRIITPSTALSTTILAGPKLQTLIMNAGEKQFYGLIQNVWDAFDQSASAPVTFDSNGYIYTKETATGDNILYITTEQGHITLTVQIPAPVATPEDPDTHSFVGIVGGVIDLTSIDGIDGTTNVPDHDITAGILTITISKKFQVTPSILIDVIAIQNPYPTAAQIPKFKLTQLTYHLQTLVNIDSRIPPSAFLPTSVPPPPGTPTYDNPYAWAPTTPGTVTGTIEVYGVKVADITAEDITIATTGVFARQGKAFSIWDHITPQEPDDVLLRITNPDTDGVSATSDGMVKINKLTTTELTAFVELKKVIVELTGGTAIPVTMISDNTLEYYISNKGWKCF